MHDNTSEMQSSQGFQQHPLSAIFPTMGPEDQQRLVLDISAHGLRNPITLMDGMVLDGWHRYEACLMLRIVPATVEFPRDQDPVACVKAMNMARRHLTASQKAVAEVACNAWAPVGFNQHQGGVAATATLTNQQMANSAGVSPRTIRDAKKAVTAGLGKDVRDGKITVEQAAAIAKLPTSERSAAIEVPKVGLKPAKVGASITNLGARVRELEDLLQERESEIHDMAELLEEAVSENKALAAELQALKSTPQSFNEAMGEVKKAREQARIAQHCLDGRMAEVLAMTKEAKKWKDRCGRLAKGKPVADLEGNVALETEGDDGFPPDECGAPSCFHGEEEVA